MEVKDTIFRENIGLGDWGVYSFGAFEKRFKEIASKTIDFDSDAATARGSYGAIYHDRLEDLLSEPRYKIPTLELKAFFKTLSSIVPRRIETPSTGDWKVESPIRESRLQEMVSGLGGFPKARIPKRGPDVFKDIIEGSKSGYAVIIGADREIDGLLDDPFSLEVKCRDLSSVTMHALAVVNKFPAFVRYIDPRIVRLITKLEPSFLNYKGVDLPAPVEDLRSLPHGINLVTFPKDYFSSLSDISIYELFTMFKATQRALRRVDEAYESQVILTGHERDEGGLFVADLVINVFMNIGALVGGTVPRLHMQTYIRARTLRDKAYERRPPKALREYHNEYMSGKSERKHNLLYHNRSCNLFSMPVNSVNHETKIELKNKERCIFGKYSEEELWDIAEMLILNSIVLDKLLRGQKRFSIKSEPQLLEDLGSETIPQALRDRFTNELPIKLSQEATVSVEVPNRRWLIIDGDKNYLVEREWKARAFELNVYEGDYAGKDRNILFYDTGAVARPFAFVGGIEQGYPALITSFPLRAFEELWGLISGRSMSTEDLERISDWDCENMYRRPVGDRIGQEEYDRLCDKDSPFFQIAWRK